MKSIKLYIALVVVLFISNSAKSQYCNTFAMSKDMVLSYQIFNAKDKEISSIKYTCTDVKTDAKGGTIYTIHSESKVPESDDITLWIYDMKCEDGKLYLSMGSFNDAELKKKYDDVDVYIDTTGMEYPEELIVGQSLPNSTITLSSGLIGVVMTTQEATITNRKVADFESINVPAGTFDCYKITFDLEIKMLTKKKYAVVQYISKGIGRIKTEAYNKKGKLVRYAVLTALTR